MKNKKKPARPDKSRPRSASSDAGNSMAPREPRKTGMSKAINPTHNLWLEIKARRDANHQQPDLDAVEPIAPPKVEHGAQAAAEVSWRVRVAAAWSWRLIAIVIVLGGVTWGISKVKVAIVPVAVALLLTLLLEPLNGRLQKWRFPNALSAAVSLIVGISALTAAIWVSVSQLASGAPALVRKAGGGFGKLMTWLSDEPLGLNSEDIDHYAKALSRQLGGLLEKYSSSIASSAWSVTSSVLNLVAAIFISVFCLFFFLKDGRRIWVWFMRLLPVPLREPVHEAGIRGWITLKGYIKAQAMVAGVDAVFISIGAAFLGAGSMTIPLALLIFLASFIPIVGAVSTGAIAVLVILLDQGLVKAIIMLVVILAVQQIESNVLQPLLMSNAVNIHPLVVLLAITVGGYFASIIGALLAVPIVAFLNTVVLYLTGHDTMPQLADQHDRVGGAPGTIHAQIQASYK
ncbi:AI-2E family transporter [Mobiluncus mulieris]|uniref:AI-2E family transporter n=1 Tax=Mobiluncus mulieris TaxID=2052 RepID=UPI001470411C|nr:AI-2E family transporter [Mobiluncus mulieris]NMW75804.1 AI-2E family transporter [Mobiluncus mulieris]